MCSHLPPTPYLGLLCARAPPLVAVAVAFPSRDPRHAAGRCVTVCVRARAWSSGEATHAAFPQTRVPSPSPQSSPAVVGSSHAAGRAARPGPLGRGQQRQRRTRPRPPFCLGLRWLSSQRTTYGSLSCVKVPAGRRMAPGPGRAPPARHRISRCIFFVDCCMSTGTTRHRRTGLC